MLSLRTAFLLFVLAACAGMSQAADWPMWRCDAGRTAATDQELPSELHLQWVRRYPALDPMGSGSRDLSRGKWDTTVGFEVVYSPIVLGTTMFVGSSANDSLSAIDVATGEEKWRFYAQGPVRLAPAGWNDRVYVTSDDGFLYCLDAAEGKLLWQFQGAPMKHRIIGDERLISAWPARGGPVISDGRVYFAASIWPFMGVYVYALDAMTGKAVWSNNEMGTKWEFRGSPKTAPQGPLVAVGDRLFVPNNWLGVSCFDRGTGEYLFDHAAKSTWRACGAGRYFVVEGSRQLSATVSDIETGDTVAALSRLPVMGGGLMYWMDAGKTKGIVAVDPAKIEPVAGTGAKKGKLSPVWTLQLKAAGERGSTVRIKTRSRLLVSSGPRVIAVDIPVEGGAPKEAWNVEVGGEVGEALVAADRLFVVTIEGGIYCFGAEKVTPKMYEAEHGDLPVAVDEWAKKAGQILETTGIKDGYALVLGLGSGRLLEELIMQSDLTVMGIDPDAAKVDAVRRKLDAAGLYGNRAHAIVGDPLDGSLPPYLASLIVSEDPEAAGIGKGEAFAAKVFHSLRPYGGVACLPAARVPASALKGWIESAKLEKAEVTPAGGFSLLARVGSLPGSAAWTHHNADEGNTVSSRDDLVRAPLGILWFGGPSGTLTIDRHFSPPRPLVAGGRIVVLGPKGLTAVDVYTGRILWNADNPAIREALKPYNPESGKEPAGADRWGSPFAYVPDGIYLAGGATCLRLDPSTGKTVSEIHLPTDGNMKTFGPIRISGDVLVAGADPIRASKALLGRRRDDAGSCRHMVAFDRTSGRALWSRTADQGFGNGTIALAEGKVFCIDRWSDTPRSKVAGGKLTALDIRTGTTIWQTEKNVFGMWLAHSPEADILLQSTGMFGFDNVHKKRVIAYRGADGTVLWDNPRAGDDRGPSMANRTAIITTHGTFDLLTGTLLKSHAKADFGKGCNYLIGNSHILAGRSGSFAYIDLDGDTAYKLGGFRSGCLNAVIPADGVLNVPYAAPGCGCALNVRTSVTLVHMPEPAAGWQ